MTQEKDIKTVLFDVVAKALNDWSMMLVEAKSSAGDSHLNPPLLKAVIAFDGFKKGKIEILASTEWCIQLGLNVMGLMSEEELPPNAQISAIQELANVVGGHFLTTYFGDKPVFNLKVAEVAECAASEINELKQSTETVFVSVEDNLLLARATVE